MSEAPRDPRTGLLTQRALLDAAAQAPPAGALLAAVHLDLCNFDLLNFVCGSRIGDAFLRSIADLLQREAGANARLAHAWGDEFQLLVGVNSPAEALERVEKLRAALNALAPPEALQGLPVLASFGVVIGRPGADLDALLLKAQLACREARRQGSNQIHLLVEDDHSAARMREQMRIGSQLLQTIRDRGLTLHAQPIFDVAIPEKPRVVKVEILLRQRTPGGDVPVPLRTVEVAERFGFVRAIDEFVLEEALSWFRAHPEALSKLERISINLSGRTLSDRGFHDHLVQRVHLGGVPARKLCFEITESSLVGSLTQLRALVQELQDMGCSVALDDFGVGLCSFGYLQDLPVDEIKIDGSFVRRMTTDPVAERIVTALKAVADATGKKTVAEFVEDRAALDLLARLGVRYVQGWLFAKAMPLDELPAYLEQHA